MGKVRTNVAFKAFSNDIDGLVYYERHGTQCVKVPGKPTDARTPKQMRVRDAMRGIIALWKQLDGIVKESWKSQGRRLRLSGYTAFFAENAVRQRDGQELVFCQKYGIEGLASFTANTGEVSGAIDCEYTAGEREDNPVVCLFARRAGTDGGNGQLTRFDGGAASGGAFTLTGLEPGAEYQVYAMLADGAYGDATMVSESSAAVCRAKE